MTFPAYLQSCRGSGTSVVSLLIPTGASIMVARSRITSELTTTANIKDRGNRHSVIAALKAVSEQLSRIASIPSTGMAIYAGECECL
jgi:peptide chain release factor subunit 1